MNCHDSYFLEVFAQLYLVISLAFYVFSLVLFRLSWNIVDIIDIVTIFAISCHNVILGPW